MEITTRQKNALKKKNIDNVLQLHRFLPLRYVDNTKETGAYENLDGMHSVIIGTLITAEKKPMKSREGNFLMMSVKDRMSGERVRAMIFGGGEPLLRKMNGMIGDEVILTGKLSFDEKFGFTVSPVETLSNKIKENMRIFPVFSKVKGISANAMSELLQGLLDKKEPETMPESIRNRYALDDINTALKGSMFPATMEQTWNGKRRLLFDDLFYLAGRFELSLRDTNNNGIRINSDAITESIIKKLCLKDGTPITLTADQQKVYDTVKSKMFAGERIKALVQGDVGCGKTIPAFLSMLLAAENGYQACLMAPTKILAEQHYNDLIKLLDGTGIEALLYTTDSESSKKQKKEDLAKIEDGTFKLIIGTTGLLSDQIHFKNLGLIVIDEEHRFGAIQRRKINEKQENCGYITMSATPIPSTLANTIYGADTEVFSIKTMPAGRKPVKTSWNNGNKIVYAVRSILERGQQVYAVCPMINENTENEKMEGIMSTEMAAKIYRKHFPDKNVAELNGQLSPEETEKVLTDFRNGDVDILVSTTIVEVGVNVPNATLIIIHNAERFGLAGMHQLRGRVGRGNAQSYCMLVSKETPSTNERIRTMCEVSDGFELSYRDMMYIRKSGSIFGEEQSGFNKYIEEMLLNQTIYDQLKEEVKSIPTEVLIKHIKKTEAAELSRYKRVLSAS